MKRLILQGNMIGNEGAKHLAEAVHNIEKLNLKMCGVHEAGVASLVRRIKDLQNPVMNLVDGAFNFFSRCSTFDCSIA